MVVGEQKTVGDVINCRGIGLHTGRKVGMVIKPAMVDQGIVFVRKDLPDEPFIVARVDVVRDTTLATTIGLDGVTVSTIEHLMSALNGMGIDNAIVELDSYEVPIMDGSALPFVNMLKEVGVKFLGKHRKVLVVKEPVSVSDDNGSAMFLPSSDFKITYTIDFDHPLIGRQTYTLTMSESNYVNEICAARTFGFLKDVEYLQAVGLALGGSLKNAVVLDERRVINKEGLRFPDEFVRHKILDAIGDLSLLGCPVRGHFIAYRSGHRLNNMLLKELLRRREAWVLVERDNVTVRADSLRIEGITARLSTS
ncbi:MAG: UDP-3-O-acyl-N-acetylglucosamine deacetylase [Syntrophales bacterium]|nr:UDP-3-O-acyl-N-acetylglucosamine deacetylase [Syntrophales bacterium]